MDLEQGVALCFFVPFFMLAFTFCCFFLPQEMCMLLLELWFAENLHFFFALLPYF